MEGKLTRCFLLFLRNPRFVLSRERSNGFVAGSQSNDAEEGEDQSGIRLDVPPTEYNAEVCCVPGEEHLR